MINPDKSISRRDFINYELKLMFATGLALSSCSPQIPPAQPTRRPEGPPAPNPTLPPSKEPDQDYAKSIIARNKYYPELISLTPENTAVIDPKTGAGKVFVANYVGPNLIIDYPAVADLIQHFDRLPTAYPQIPYLSGLTSQTVEITRRSGIEFIVILPPAGPLPDHWPTKRQSDTGGTLVVNDPGVNLAFVRIKDYTQTAIASAQKTFIVESCQSRINVPKIPIHQEIFCNSADDAVDMKGNAVLYPDYRKNTLSRLLIDPNGQTYPMLLFPEGMYIQIPPLPPSFSLPSAR